MEALAAAQENLARKINNVYTKFASKPVEEQTKGLAQAYLQRLEEYFNSFNAHHDKILKLKNVADGHE